MRVVGEKMEFKRKIQSFLKGIGSVLDLGGTMFPRREFMKKSDEEALREDWEAVGSDIRKAIKKYEEEEE